MKEQGLGKINAYVGERKRKRKVIWKSEKETEKLKREEERNTEREAGKGNMKKEYVGQKKYKWERKI